MSKGAGKPKQLSQKPSKLNNSFNKINSNGSKNFGAKTLPKPTKVIKD